MNKEIKIRGSRKILFEENKTKTISSKIDPSRGFMIDAEKLEHYMLTLAKSIEDLVLVESKHISYDDWYYSFSLIKESQDVKRLILKLRNYAKEVLNSSILIIRDLRKQFTKNHSFHFKNLDDCDDDALINTVLVS